MKILITGATGFVGRSLCLQLQGEGYDLVAVSRNAARARSLLGPEVQVIAMDDLDTGLRRVLPRVTAVINLAGEAVIGKRWSARQKKKLHGSRVGLTRRIVSLLAEIPNPPTTLISASAVGIYGERVDCAIGEDAPAGDDYLAQLCSEWEQEANRAQELGTRVVTLRTGIVLGMGGGALPRLLPAFGLGLGGRMGDGQQAMPWIHLHDLVQIISTALHDTKLRGPINAVSPNPVTNQQFTRSLGMALNRPTPLPIPKSALRLLLGEASGVLLGGQRALPNKLLAHGFQFKFADLSSALEDLVNNDKACLIERATDIPTSEYLKRRAPVYELRQQTLIDAPIAEVLEFFSRAENLGQLTPPSVDFKITSPPMIEMSKGSTISYTISLGRIPLRWKTEIERWDPEGGFVDVQMKGPYRSWWHEHRFRQFGSLTLMEDRVLYALPFGLLGRLAHAIKVSSMLKQIFAYRSQAIAFRFGKARPSKLKSPAKLKLCGPLSAASAGR